MRTPCASHCGLRLSSRRKTPVPKEWYPDSHLSAAWHFIMQPQQRWLTAEVRCECKCRETSKKKVNWIDFQGVAPCGFTVPAMPSPRLLSPPPPPAPGGGWGGVSLQCSPVRSWRLVPGLQGAAKREGQRNQDADAAADRQRQRSQAAGAGGGQPAVRPRHVPHGARGGDPEQVPGHPPPPPVPVTPPPPPLSKQCLCPGNTGRRFHQFLRR